MGKNKRKEEKETKTLLGFFFPINSFSKSYSKQLNKCFCSLKDKSSIFLRFF